MNTCAVFSPSVLDIDASSVACEIENWIRGIVRKTLRRNGAVIALSGGVDSSVTAALCARALGKDRVFGLIMPESESSGDSAALGALVADVLGIEAIIQNIGATLETVGCYSHRDEAIRKVIPEYGDGWKSKIVLPDIINDSYCAIYSVVAEDPEGHLRRARLTPEAYCSLIAAMSLKQRVRATIEYYHADRFWYAVAGTPNRLEFAQGFFVKNGDGSADFKPIAHLYKTQVYALGEHLGIPNEVLRRPPTTDTYGLTQSQEEFYFVLPLRQMDLCLYARNNNVPPNEAAAVIGLTTEQVCRAYALIDSRLRATEYLHMRPQTVEPVSEVKA